jgi:hypothetical protein
LKTNIEAYLFSLNEGFLLKDANIILKELTGKNKIEFDFKLISSKLHKEPTLKIKLK